MKYFINKILKHENLLLALLMILPAFLFGAIIGHFIAWIVALSLLEN